MTIDWSKAPEYATHWCPKINMFHTDAALCEECIPRPQKPEVEWDGIGLPPVGCECESATRGSGYRAGHITYISDQILVWMDRLSGHEYATRPHDREFRPIRTKEQRQRDELAEVISSELGEGKYLGQGLADKIIAAGWKKDA